MIVPISWFWNWLGATSHLVWAIEFDWDNDGVFEDEIFDLTTHLKTSRGRKTMLSDRGFTRQQVGELVLMVDNEDGRFDMLNSASPIYPNALPGRECKVTVSSSGVTYPIFRGRVTDITPIGADFSRQATIKVQDGWAALKNKISYGVVEDEDTGSLIGRVLDKAGYVFSDGGGVSVWRFPTRIGETSYFGPPDWTRALGLGADIVDYWWLSETPADEAINELTESEFGLFWFGADGVANFMGRHELFDQASAATLTQSTFLRSLASRQSLKTIRNVIRVKAYPKVLQPPAVLWKLGSKPLIPAGETVTYWPQFKFENREVAAIDLESPVASTDYTANTLQNGGGVDTTSSFSIEVANQGATAELRVTNNGTVSAYLTLLRLRGVAIDVPDTAQVESTDSDSVDAFQPREITLDLKWQDDVATAQDFADYLKGWLPDFQPSPLVEIEHRPSVQFAHDLFARLTVQLASLDVDQDFRIGQIEHQWLAPTGQGVKTTWYLEPIVYQSNYWQFPTRIGLTSRFAF